ncbi:hypothetical protein [Bacillus taeanensis]|uniref:Uncharacterized protein n=1 Tax=Bacillus taeanensis TaxID=273032 RepID=A0A366XQC3_9BACI|nr:hypothetical protein [Bacillus taeanensis]RBW68312.1 hypothetical protein DS031_17480 [Bacillus taeanensis]
MKKVNKVSASLITASLLAIPFIQSADTALADNMKHQQVQKGNHITNTHKEMKSPFTINESAWDRSSLVFSEENINSDGIFSIVKNGEDSQAMQGEVIYEVFWAEKGNPKEGEIVDTGVIEELMPGETQVLTYTPEQLKSGNYMFKAYQRPNHPGKGELWSESITVKETTDSNESIIPERPLDQFFNSNVTEGTATFTVPDGMDPVEMSFTSYVYPDGVVPGEDGKPYEGQTAYDNITKVYEPGTHTINVDLPENGYFQTDLYLGAEIENLTEDGHPIEKIIDADYGFNN